MNQGGRQYTLKRNDLWHPDLSYKINSVLFDVFKQIGGGHLEKYYYRPIAMGFKKNNIGFQQQVYVPLKYDEEIVGKYFLDFLIENKTILEIKRGKIIPVNFINQTKRYLETMDLRLGIIACFTYDGVVIKRIVNEY